MLAQRVFWPAIDRRTSIDPESIGTGCFVVLLALPEQRDHLLGLSIIWASAQPKQVTPERLQDQDHMARASYTSTLPPSVSTGQPSAFAAASARDAALMIE